MKNLSRSTAPRKDEVRDRASRLRENPDLGWDRRPTPEEDADLPRIESLDRIPFTRDAAERWLR